MVECHHCFLFYFEQDATSHQLLVNRIPVVFFQFNLGHIPLFLYCVGAFSILLMIFFLSTFFQSSDSCQYSILQTADCVFFRKCRVKSLQEIGDFIQVDKIYI